MVKVKRRVPRDWPEPRRERVAAAVPGVRPISSRLEPAAGAVLLALDAAGRAVDPPLLERLSHSLPEAALFSTQNVEKLM